LTQSRHDLLALVSSDQLQTELINFLVQLSAYNHANKFHLDSVKNSRLSLATWGVAYDSVLPCLYSLNLREVETEESSMRLALSVKLGGLACPLEVYTDAIQHTLKIVSPDALLTLSIQYSTMQWAHVLVTTPVMSSMDIQTASSNTITPLVFG